METVYAVMKQEFNYNDEIYYFDGISGTPKVAYRDKARAKKDVEELTFDFWRRACNDEYGSAFAEYGYDKRDIFDQRYSLENILGTDDLYEVSWSELTDEQLSKLAKACTIKPYYIQEIQIGS